LCGVEMPTSFAPTFYDRAWAAGQDNFGSSGDERYWSLAAEETRSRLSKRSK